MLRITDIRSGYNKKAVLYGINLSVHNGERVALIGPNGAGKSTILNTICGLLSVGHGEIWFCDELISGSTASQNVSRGIVLAPQSGRVFSSLTVMENLEVGARQLPRNDRGGRIEEVLRFFPMLKNRAGVSARSLSGGEQQMLSLARSLVPRPKLLLLDEPSLGLSPKLVDAVFEKIIEIRDQESVGTLIVEQRVRRVLEITDRCYVVKAGKIAFEGPSRELSNDKSRLRELYL